MQYQVKNKLKVIKYKIISTIMVKVTKNLIEIYPKLKEKIHYLCLDFKILLFKKNI
jgi:hypothetical protein